MYLTARLIALSIYCVLLFGFCLTITKVKYTRTQLFLYVLILALMGFYFVPDEGSDLVRIFPLVSMYGELSWAELLQTIRYSPTPMSAVYYHVIGRLGNEHWLPAINALITFSFCFAMLYQSCKKYALRNGILALILFFFMSRGLFMMTIANIRTMLALSIVGYCIYREILEERVIWKHVVLLIVAALLHPTAIAALLIYFTFTPCYNLKSSKTILRWIQTSLVFVLLGSGGFYYLQRSIAKGQHYVEKSLEGNGYFYIWELFISVLVLLLTFYMVGAFLTEKPWFRRNLKSNETQYLIFLSCLAGFDLLAFTVEFNIGLRLGWLVAILDMPLFAMIFANPTLTSRKKLWLQYVLFGASLLILFLVCARGHLCSLKFFEYL